MHYWPNPAHKRSTTEVGPPRWAPDKEPCPSDLTVEERNHLFEGSLPVDPNDARSRRFAIRRTAAGLLEIYDIKFGREVDGDPEFHGHPANRIDRKVLRTFLKRGTISEAEYRRLARELPGC